MTAGTSASNSGTGSPAQFPAHGHRRYRRPRDVPTKNAPAATTVEIVAPRYPVARADPSAFVACLTDRSVSRDEPRQQVPYVDALRVLGAEHGEAVGQQRPQRRGGPSRIAGLAPEAGKVG